MALTPKQDRFCEEYLVDLNATQAAIRAGYSEKTARQIANRLLTIVDIQERISELRDKLSKKAEVSVERVLKELVLIGFSDISDVLGIEEGGMIIAKRFDEMGEGKSRLLKAIKEDRIIRETPDGKQVILQDKVRYEIWDKLKALELLAR